MVRSEGRHVSHAIRKLCIQLGHFEDSPLPEDKTRMELGSAFEDALARALAERMRRSEPDRYAYIGEQCFEGVYGSPDIFDVTDHAVIEVKLTWLSIKHDPEGEKFWKYWKQLQAYCKMLDTRKGRLHIAHVNGDYSYGRGAKVCPWCKRDLKRDEVGDGPHYHVWEPDGGEFKQAELDSNWAMIKAYS